MGGLRGLVGLVGDQKRAFKSYGFLKFWNNLVVVPDFEKVFLKK